MRGGNSVTYTPLRILLVIFLIAVNGLFAGAEVALVSVRHSRLRQMAENGQAGAQAALSLLANPGRLLSVTQVGVTLASLGLGWAGEGTMYGLLVSAIQPATALEAKLLAAQRSISRGRTKSAKHQLDAFINQVKASS